MAQKVRKWPTLNKRFWMYMYLKFVSYFLSLDVWHQSNKINSLSLLNSEMGISRDTYT